MNSFKPKLQKTNIIVIIIEVLLWTSSPTLCMTLYDAVKTENLEKIKELVAQRTPEINKTYTTNPLSKDNYFDGTLLFYAAREEKLQIVEELLKHPDIDPNKKTWNT